MPRDQRAYLADVIDSCEAIELAIAGLDLSSYTASRLVRSSVEREFIIIGEAVAALACKDFSPRIVRAYVEKHFSSDVMARRYRDLYRPQTRVKKLIEEMGDLMEAS